MRPHRGSALLVAVVLVAVLAVVGLALINRTTAETDAASAKRKYDRMISCAEGARQMVLSQFRVFGANPANIKIDTTADGMRVTTGHYDQFNVASVVRLAGSSGSTSVANAAGAGISVAGDMANRMKCQSATNCDPFSNNGTNGVWRISVVCTDTSTQYQQEVEFDVRFGM